MTPLEELIFLLNLQMFEFLTVMFGKISIGRFVFMDVAQNSSVSKVVFDQTVQFISVIRSIC